MQVHYCVTWNASICFQAFTLQELSDHAIYMRLKRLCEPTGTGRVQCSADIAEQWKTGCRDTLTLALVRALKAHGTKDDKKTRDAVRVGCFKSLYNMSWESRDMMHTVLKWIGNQFILVHCSVMEVKQFMSNTLIDGYQHKLAWYDRLQCWCEW